MKFITFVDTWLVIMVCMVCIYGQLHIDIMLINHYKCSQFFAVDLLDFFKLCDATLHLKIVGKQCENRNV